MSGQRGAEALGAALAIAVRRSRDEVAPSGSGDGRVARHADEETDRPLARSKVLAVGGDPFEAGVMASRQEEEVELPGSHHALELADSRLGNGTREITDGEDLLAVGQDELRSDRGCVHHHHVGRSCLELLQLWAKRSESAARTSAISRPVNHASTHRRAGTEPRLDGREDST
jgi:hypothetical protein